MVVIGELPETVKTRSVVAVHAPDDVTLSESAAAQHFGFCGELIVPDVVGAEVGEPTVSAVP